MNKFLKEMKYGMESIHEVGIESLADKVKRVMPTFAYNFIDFIKSIALRDKELKFEYDAKVLKEKMSISYLDLKVILVDVPAGFRGNLADYTAVLEGSAKFVNTIESSLNDYNRYLGGLVMDPSKKMNLKPLFKITDKLNGDLTKYKKMVETYFPGNTTAFQEAYGDVFKRNGDFVDAFGLAEKAVDEFNKAKATNIRKLLKVSADNLNELGRMANEQEFESITDVVAKELTQVTFLMSELVNFYIYIGNRIEEVSGCLNGALKTLPGNSN